MPFTDPMMDAQLPPELAGQAQQLRMRDAITQAMMNGALTPPEVPEAKGRFQATVSPFSVLASAAKAAAAGYGMGQSAAAHADIANKYQEGVTNALANYQQTKAGTPASEIAWNQQTRPDGTGDATTAVPAVAGNPRQAVINAMASPYPQVASIGKLDYQQMNKDPTKVDAGDRIDLYKGAERIGSVPKSVSPDAALTDTRARDINSTVSANTAASNATTARGQDLTDARDRELYGLKGSGADNKDGTIGPLSPMMEIQANAIATGQQKPVASRAGRPSPIMARVMEINPDYRESDYGSHAAGEKYFTSGKGGQTIKSLSVAHSHLDTLEGLVDAMNNGDTPALNRLANTWKTQTGQTAPNNFETAKKIVGDEIVKAVVGAGGGVADREEAAKTMAAWSTPAQLKEGIGVYKELMRGQLGGLRGQYEQSTGRNDFDTRFLSPSVAAGQGGGTPAAGAPSVESLLEKYK